MNLPSNPSSEWQQLGDRFYRKVELYASLSWNEQIDLAKFTVCGAPYGGPLAVSRDEKKIVAMNDPIQPPKLQIFTSSGKKLSESNQWEKGRIVVGMGWTEEERLVCVFEDGNVSLFNVHCKEDMQFNLGREVKEKGIQEVKIWSTGLACLTRSLEFVCVVNFTEPRTKIFDRFLTEAPLCWALIEPQYTLSLNLELLVATSNTVWSMYGSERKNLLATSGPFCKITVSPQGKFLACFSTSGMLFVMPSDMSKNLTQFDTKTKAAPDQMEWCGVDAVVMYWRKVNLIVIIGPRGDWIRYNYESPLYLVPECDGVRIICNDKCEFLQRVPDSIENIFKIGSTAPSAILYDALEHFEKKNPKADENVRSIKNELSEAVSQCLEAAGHEFSEILQRTLLKAASFGKIFIDFYDPTPFVEMCKNLRILNAVRYYEIGLPISFQQYQRLGITGVVDRLTNHHHHLLAYRICEFMKISKDKVLVHWACLKVCSPGNENSIRDMIVEKLADVPGISYAEIASTAYKHSRKELATKLLDYEPKAANQVPLLMSMQQEELALDKAIESGDTNLVYLVVLHMKRSMQIVEFLRVIRSKPFALDLFLSYYRQEDLKLLKEVYSRLDKPQEVATIFILESQREKDFDKRIAKLQEAMNIFLTCKDNFSARSTEDQIRLLLLQKELEATIEGTKFLDLSVSETTFQLILSGQSKRASKLKSDFKVPDKRFWWIKVKALSQLKDWPALEKFAKDKSPIGYHPFADGCIEAGAITEAIKYIRKISDPSLRVQYFVNIGNFIEAADVAKSIKDVSLLTSIKSKCTGNVKATSYIDQILAQLNQ